MVPDWINLTVNSSCGVVYDEELSGVVYGEGGEGVGQVSEEEIRVQRSEEISHNAQDRRKKHVSEIVATVAKKDILAPCVQKPKPKPKKCPVLTSTNYPVWAIKVKTIMDAYGIWEAIEPTVGAAVDPKKSKMALAFLIQAIPEELVLQMESDTVDDFASKLSGLASKSRSLGSNLEEKVLVRRLLDSMPKSFLQIVASIEQCFELDTMPFDEAIGRLMAYEERIKGPNKEEEVQGRLMFSKREKEKKHGCEHCGCGSSNRDDFRRGRGRGRGSGKSQDCERFQRDKSHVRCFKCGEFGHFVNECPKWGKREEVNLSRCEDDEPTLL
ncbi:hypothetical protein E3N88_00980 [Mikania micrantha]|uniref:CCHC-type domain-containing protein n=1 Tax=Mikania micrantha TaxID=192012 RepID=A0A5N6PZP3_9ASTR|nr:hypothetical protein E3N88_00980 [Mikania micrantha]